MDDNLGSWPVSVADIPVAWGDMDAFGHVNNTVYLRWFETARIAYFERIGMTARDRGAEAGDVGPILARATCDFRLPLVYPDRVTVEATVHRLGRTSFVMGYRVRSAAHDGAIAAEGEGVIVMMDYATGQKVPVPEPIRAAIRDAESSA